MPDTIMSWLDGVGSTAFTWSAVAFVLVNGAGLATVFLTRDRGFVNRWTSGFLAVNLALLGTGLGVPLVALAARSVVSAVTPFRASTQADAELMPASGRETDWPR
ncbi:MAG TPA: hypothetical protein VF981_06080 [Gemmatimonadaceae bacterium]|jgi:hypothetical protein